MAEIAKRGGAQEELVIDPSRGLPPGVDVVYEIGDSNVPTQSETLTLEEIDDTSEWWKVVQGINIISQEVKTVNGVAYVDVVIEPFDVQGAIEYEVRISEV